MKAEVSELINLFKVKPEACNFTEINTPPLVFFTFLKLYKCHQIAQRITYGLLNMISSLGIGALDNHSIVSLFETNRLLHV